MQWNCRLVGQKKEILWEIVIDDTLVPLSKGVERLLAQASYRGLAQNSGADILRIELERY